MKMVIKDLLEKKGAIDKILKKDLPFKTAYRLGKIAAKMMAEFKHIEKIRVEIIKKFSPKNKNGNLQVPPDKMGAYLEEWETFLEESTTLNTEKIPLECLAEVTLSPEDIANLSEFLEGEKKTIIEKGKE